MMPLRGRSSLRALLLVAAAACLLAARAAVASNGNDALQPTPPPQQQQQPSRAALLPPDKPNGTDAAGAAVGAGDGDAQQQQAVWTWKSFKGLLGPIKRAGLTLVPLAPESDQLVLFGGCYLDLQCYDDLWAFDSAAMTWYELQRSGSSPSRRGFHSAVVIDGSMVVFGGVDAKFGSRHSDVFALELANFTWSQLAPIGSGPMAVEGHTAVAAPDGSMIVFGGFIGDGPGRGYTNAVHRLAVRGQLHDRGTPSWSRVSTTGLSPSPRSGHAAAVHGSTMYVFGGFSAATHDVGTLFGLDMTTWEWSAISTQGPAPGAWHGSAMTAFKGTLFVTGGCNYARETCSSATNALDLASGQWNLLDIKDPSPPPPPPTASAQDPRTSAVTNDLVNELLAPPNKTLEKEIDKLEGVPPLPPLQPPEAAGNSSGASNGTNNATASSLLETAARARGDGSQTRYGDHARPLQDHSHAESTEAVALSPRGFAGATFGGSSGDLYLFGGGFLDANCSFDTLVLHLPDGFAVKVDPMAIMNPVPARTPPVSPAKPHDAEQDAQADLAAAAAAAPPPAAAAVASAQAAQAAKGGAAAPNATAAGNSSSSSSSSSGASQQQPRFAEQRRHRRKATSLWGLGDDLLIEERADTAPLSAAEKAEQEQHERDKVRSAQTAPLVEEQREKSSSRASDAPKGDFEAATPEDAAKVKKAAEEQKKLLETALVGDSFKGMAGGGDEGEAQTGSATAATAAAGSGNSDAAQRARKRAQHQAADELDQAQAEAEAHLKAAGIGADGPEQDSSSGDSSGGAAAKIAGTDEGPGGASSGSGSGSGSSSAGNSVSRRLAAAAAESAKKAAKHAQELGVGQVAKATTATLSTESQALVADMFVPLLIVLALMVACGAYVFCVDTSSELKA